ncbi:MAG: flagellar biosynthesis protein FlhB [Epulopiscium sp.]|nr:flagellar biosynthesis protein FlhB [Candidatus Epulonipiscium sp.]
MKKRLYYELQFFAKEGPGGEKTEKATPRKREKAREEGQIAKSTEVNTAFLLVSMFLGIKIFSPYVYDQLLQLFRYTYQMFSMREDFYQEDYMGRWGAYLFQKTVFILGPFLIIALLAGITANFLQVGWHPTWKPLQPKWNRLSPLQGFKRLFSKRALMEFMKSILKIVIIGFILYSSIKKEKNNIYLLYDMNVLQIVGYVGNIAIGMALKVGIFFIFLAVGDFIYQKYELEQDLKMTKQELKEEYKMQEGNPEIKGKIRQKMREISMRRMMQDLPQADVIITNPTHFAVAIQYDPDTGQAPVVIAKGMNLVAQRIKEIGKENNIQIVENKPLARTLYYTVDIGKEIPPELYQTVAEILAWVYQLKHREG